MSKKNDILNKTKGSQELDLNEEEKMQLASLIALMEQARMAQDILYSNLVQSVASRYEVSDKDIGINMEQVIKEGTKVAKLVVS